MNSSIKWFKTDPNIRLQRSTGGVVQLPHPVVQSSYKRYFASLNKIINASNIFMEFFQKLLTINVLVVHSAQIYRALRALSLCHIMSPLHRISKAKKVTNSWLSLQVPANNQPFWVIGRRHHM